MMPNHGGQTEGKGAEWLNPRQKDGKAYAASPHFPQKPEWKHCSFSLRVFCKEYTCVKSAAIKV